MTVIDAAILTIMLLSGLLALMRGFTQEVLSIIAWAIAAVAALQLFPYISPIMADYVSPSWLADVITAAGIFFIVLIALSIVTYRWSERIQGGQIGPLDRSLGFLFGLARGLLVIVVAYMFFAWLVPKEQHPTWLTEARFLPMIEASAQALLAFVPDDPNRLIGDSVAPVEGSGTNGAANGPNGDTPPDSADGEGYTSRERQGLDRLFESATDE